MSYRWEMLDGGKWIANGLRFATKAEAEDYGADLAWRWTRMPEPARAAESDDPVTHRWDAEHRRLTNLETGAGHVPPFRVKLEGLT